MAKKREVQALFGLIILALAALVLLAWAAWLFFETYISPDWTRIIALVGLVALPITGWLCYSLGLTEAKGKLVGIDLGINKVVRAASETINLRSTAARAMRDASRPEVRLPQIPPMIITRRQLSDGNGEVVEL